MTVALDQFVRQLEDSQIVSGETLKDFLPPRGSPADAEGLARELVRQKHLTGFQAQSILHGKAKLLVLGNYVLLEKIGAGGMGQVFKARHRRMDRIVAVKVLPPQVMKQKDVIARFEREVKAAARISHPNIVAAYDADCAGGVHFLVMEYVEGSDLAALVKKDGPLSVEQAVDFLLQAARGLAAAHADGIVHRDIKPGNLLLDRKGVVKILDMGLARIRGDVAGQAELTATGAIMGTVDYMAPEQALSTKSADARADIYSLGCSLFYLLTGKAMYDGETLTEKLLAHQNQPVPSLRSVRPEVPELLEAVFERMAAKKTADRYQSMTEVSAALEQFARADESAMGQLASGTSSMATGSTQKSPAAVSISPVAPLPGAKSATFKFARRYVLFGVVVAGVLLLAGGLLLKFTVKNENPSANKTFEVKRDASQDPQNRQLASAATSPSPKREEETSDKSAASPGIDIARMPATLRPVEGDNFSEAPGESESAVPDTKVERGKPIKPDEPEPVSGDNFNAGQPPSAPHKENVETPLDAADSVADRLAAVKAEFASAVKRAEEKLLARFDAQIQAMRTVKVSAEDRLKLIETVKAEKEAFNRSGAFPWSGPMRTGLFAYVKSMTLAARDLEKSFDREIDRATKRKDEEAAAKLLTEKKALLTSRAIGALDCTGTTFNRKWRIVLFSNGTITNPAPGTWTFDHDVLVLYLPDAKAPKGIFIDRCALAIDGKSLSAVSNSGGKWTAKFVLPSSGR